ncbi:cytochrome c oxidase subunit 5a, partial [Lecanoromycetidae sp. Uapishka_2]
MSSTSILRLTARTPPSCLFRSHQPARRLSPPRSVFAGPSPAAAFSPFSTSRRRAADKDGQEATGGSGHAEESFEEFTARYEKEFDSVQDVFELQRNLNNAFAYDLVPSPSVITAALRAARRVNDFPTAAKVENKGQYDEYLRDLEPLREELGVNLKEDLYPDQLYTAGANTHQ